MSLKFLLRIFNASYTAVAYRESVQILGCAIQKNIRQIFDMAFSLESFHEQRMPFILRLPFWDEYKADGFSRFW